MIFIQIGISNDQFRENDQKKKVDKIEIDKTSDNVNISQRTCIVKSFKNYLKLSRRIHVK